MVVQAHRQRGERIVFTNMAVLNRCMLVIFTNPACACTRGALDRRAQR